MKRAFGSQLLPYVAPWCAGVLARLLFIAWTSPLTLSSDEERFWDLATTRMEGTAYLPPLQPLVLAAARAAVGDDPTLVRILLALVASVSIVLVGLLAERHQGSGTGVIPAWVMALLPTLVYYDGRLRSEPMVILLLLTGAVLWTRAGAGRASRLTAGLPLGLAALGRPEMVLLPVALAVASARRAGAARALGRCALLVPGLVLVLVPWTLRNHHVTGAWTLVSANGGYNFWKSFNAATDGSQIPLYEPGVWDGSAALASEADGYRAGWGFIRDRPVRSVLLAPAKVGHLFGPERGYLSDLRQGGVPRRGIVLELGFAALQNGVFLLLLAGGLYAMIGPHRSEVKDYAVALLGLVVAVHLVFFGDDRFHVSLLPLFCAVLPEAWDGSARSRRALRLLGLCLGALALFWLGVLGRDLTRIGGLWRG